MSTVTISVLKQFVPKASALHQTWKAGKASAAELSWRECVEDENYKDAVVNEDFLAELTKANIPYELSEAV
ncbi:hypothetical protein AZ09_05170 [Acetobacter aceti 1023]|nr:hypothetical protein AZ09_05170 [Acetobacter aceti 1023]